MNEWPVWAHGWTDGYFDNIEKRTHICLIKFHIRFSVVNKIQSLIAVNFEVMGLIYNGADISKL